MNVRKSIVAACACVLVLGISASAQTLDETDVRKAIKAGGDRRLDDLLWSCTAGAGYREKVRANAPGGSQPVGVFSVTVSTNVERIAFLAAEAKRLNQLFSPADVSDQLRRAAVYVLADPKKPASAGRGFNGDIT